MRDEAFGGPVLRLPIFEEPGLLFLDRQEHFLSAPVLKTVIPSSLVLDKRSGIRFAVQLIVQEVSHGENEDSSH